MRSISWQWPAALLAGLGLGLLYAWVISPVRYLDTAPDTLRLDFKDSYRASIAAAYAATGDLERARARLALMGDTDPVDALTAQAQRMLAAGEQFDSIRQVARLATDLRTGASSGPSLTARVVSGGTRAPTLTGAPPGTESAPEAATSTSEAVQPPNLDTPTPRPTRTPTATPGAPFAPITQEAVCNPNLTEGLLQVSVLDARRRQLPGVELIITWDGGEEHFFTGFKPEIGNGYADFLMRTGVIYSLRAASGGTAAENLSAPACTDAGGAPSYTGSLHITFQQP
jgi:hypothetical protein